MNLFPDRPDRVTGGLTEEQRRHLDRLEQVQAPTGWQKGELAALAMNASGDDRRRADALRARWGRQS